MSTINSVGYGCAVAFSLFVIGCSGPDWEGTYTVDAEWNLKGPLSDGRTVGQAMADLVLHELVSRTPLPSAAERSIEAKAAELYRDDIAELFDSSSHAVLPLIGADAALLALGNALGALRVQSELELEEGGDGVEGEERLLSVAFNGPGGTTAVLPVQLGEEKIEAEWEGEVDGQQFVIEPHDLGIHYGQLVNIVAANVLSEADTTRLRSSVLMVLDCGMLTTRILGSRGSLEINAGITSLTINGSLITDACTLVRSQLEQRVLALFALDAKISLGGVVTFVELGDGRATLANGPNFGGLLKIAPDAIAPKVSATFAASER